MDEIQHILKFVPYTSCPIVETRNKKLVNQGLYTPITHMSKHEITHIQDLALSISVYTRYLFGFHVVVEIP